MTKELKLFVAYAHEDRDHAARLIDVLQKREWKVYWDEELVAGQHGWQETLEQELKESFGVVVLWSSHSITSDAVISEARTARDMKKLYAVSIDNSDLPAEFAKGAWAVNLNGWNGDPHDHRIDKILAWPEALAKFHKGLGHAIPVMAPVSFKQRSAKA